MGYEVIGVYESARLHSQEMMTAEASLRAMVYEGPNIYENYE